MLSQMDAFLTPPIYPPLHTHTPSHLSPCSERRLQTLLVGGHAGGEQQRGDIDVESIDLKSKCWEQMHSLALHGAFTHSFIAN